jgi:glycosyltransferase involved in cell wall biosynthesis
MSTIVPISNPERYHDNLKDWLKKEIFSNVEVIFIHDNQGSEGVLVLEKLAAEFPEILIRIFEGNFASPGLTRNLGIAMSRGEWITFCDADDFQYTQEILAQVMNVNNESVVFGQFQRKLRKGGKLSKVQTQGISDIWVDPGFWRAAYRREFISSFRFNNLKMGEDVVFLADVLRSCEEISIQNALFYEYRIGNSGQSIYKTENFQDIPNAMRIIMSKNPNWKRNTNDMGFLTRLAFTHIKLEVKRYQRVEIKLLLQVFLCFSKSRLEVPLHIFFRRRNR